MNSVNCEAAPEYIADFAGDNLGKLRLFADALVAQGTELGLIGPFELPRLWTRHIVNSGLLAPLLRPQASVVDIGTGGGFPGIVLAIMRPDVTIKMIEPMERRCTWLHGQIANLELSNAQVMRGRAEEYHGAVEVDQVTARAVTALRKLIPITAPLLKPGGEMLFLKGESVEAEIEAALKVIRKYKITNYRVAVLGADFTEPTRVFIAG
ncbi:16S rRNA (guanine(527)-N(7))-methyltransferase RsmG [Canibacter sp. lx-72]|uniref:16S rRNA (guanine(527)-N(7))-methyltransferase RsmG n=1 Tax=Canibacter zhuwentaonis TaxID=2837491 RepID=UPI001BDD8A56|nr:16S rRNA (guanine(527)-N(7))-methyltransferase RsmG [Canibacter zhuwentaonis]MBT1018115.1 16S rRNA (guanine(527)-N(7))-methyltransferase RsmG [Canibacter zhuwentaonis]MBT1035350.1 16S rRNA (guanine(527)-N(7))-methyltransferase RsmG [Canibacter zhuwentaonis]